MFFYVCEDVSVCVIVYFVRACILFRRIFLWSELAFFCLRTVDRITIDRVFKCRADFTLNFIFQILAFILPTNSYITLDFLCRRCFVSSFECLSLGLRSSGPRLKDNFETKYCKRLLNPDWKENDFLWDSSFSGRALSRVAKQPSLITSIEMSPCLTAHLSITKLLQIFLSTFLLYFK